MDQEPTWFPSRSRDERRRAESPARAPYRAPASLRSASSSGSTQNAAPSSAGTSRRPHASTSARPPIPMPSTSKSAHRAEASFRPGQSTSRPLHVTSHNSRPSSSDALADIDNPMPTWTEPIVQPPLNLDPPTSTLAGSNQYNRQPKSTVWKGKDGSIWSSPSVSAWPPNVPASGPSRDLSIEDWEKSAQDRLISEEATNPYQLTWWKAERPYIPFYPRAPLIDDQGVLKSLARSKTVDDTVVQTKDGKWVPRQSLSWVDLSFMLHIIASVLFFAFGKSGRFPVRQWKPYPVGWWNAWVSDRDAVIHVVRIQLHHLVAFCASISYICAIARFETGDPDAWYRRLAMHGLNESVHRWCERLRHTWVPLMQDTKRVGTFFDARDIKWPDLIQLYLDSGIPFIIFWGNDAGEIANIASGIIPDRFRPSLGDIASASPPPDMFGDQFLGGGASTGLKRDRDNGILNHARTPTGTVDLQPIRDHFRKRHVSHLKHLNDACVPDLFNRGHIWQVAAKDKGWEWSVDEETGTVIKEMKNGKRFEELLEFEDSPWLVRFDYTGRTWHRLPDGTFPSPALVRLRGIDIEGAHDRDDLEWWKDKKCPNMTDDDWAHLSSVQALVCDLPVPRLPLNADLLAMVQQMDAECDNEAIIPHDKVAELPSLTAEPVESLLPPEPEDPLPSETGPPAELRDDNAGLTPLSVFESGETLRFNDWDIDAACSPLMRMRIPSPRTVLDRAGFISSPDDVLARLVRTPPLAPKSTKGTPPLLYSLLSLGSWTSGLSRYNRDWQSISPAEERALEMGRSGAFCDAIPDFVERLSRATWPPRPLPQNPHSDYNQPAPPTWMYTPGLAANAWAVIRETNEWNVADGFVKSSKGDQQVWILSRVDGLHERLVVLYHASIVVQILRDPTSFRTGDDILKYCAESAIKVNEAGTRRLAPDSSTNPASVDGRTRTRAIARSSRVLGYKAKDHIVSPYDFADYEEARSKLFADTSIWLGAIKAGGLLARLALEHESPELVLVGPHADAAELGLGQKIQSIIGTHTHEYVDDVLTPELELFIVGGFYQQQGHERTDLDYVRTFFPRASTWDAMFPSPGWDFEKEAIYQNLRTNYLRPKVIGSTASRFQPLSGNAWKEKLRQKAPFTRKCALVIEQYARMFLTTRSEHFYSK